MKIKQIFLLSIMVSLLLASCGTNTKEMEVKETNKAINLDDLDTTYCPRDDFYEYATGGWQKNNPLPDEESRFGAFDAVSKETNERVKNIIIELSKENLPADSDNGKVANLYRMGMDSVKIDADGIKPIESILSEIDNLESKEQLVSTIAKLHRMGLGGLFNLFGSADSDNSAMQIAYLYQGGLGLPNRDYYTETDETSVNIRKEYLTHIERMLDLANVNDAKNIASKIYEFENGLALKSMTSLELRDPYNVTNKMSFSELTDLASNFDFPTYFNIVGLEALDVINVAQPNFFKYISEIVDNTDLETWKAYLKWNVINRAAPYLSTDFVNANFDFKGKTLTGALVQKPRWRNVVNTVNDCLGDAVGQAFVNKFFPPQAKERMDNLVNNLRTAFALRIKNLEWMGSETEKKALDKLDAITVKIGYPNKWKDYSKLEIKDDSYFANILRSNEFGFDRMIEKIGKPIDKDEWFMNPHTVNAYYSPRMNEICFPAGILQPPFFYLDADDAVNYGAIGVVIGHEITHGFDDKGSKYDKDGNLNDWWTKEDEEKFNEQTKILADRFSAIEVLPGLFGNGELCLGENIADFGGLKISFDALMVALNGEVPEKIDGFTAEQRFYLAYAKVWGQNIRDEEIRRRTKVDVHSLGKWRVNAQVPAIKSFHDAFGVVEGDKMYMPEDKWANIW